MILNVDLYNDHIDVREGLVLDMDAHMVVVSQTNPPVLRSMVGRSVEATFVTRNPLNNMMVRWGWQGQVVNVVNDYRLRLDDQGRKADPAAVVMLSLPATGALTETNVRMDYRLLVNSNEKATIQTHPSFGRVTLLDFSAGGVLLRVPAPPQAELGMKLWFTLSFAQSPQPQISINGEAEVVRIMYDQGEPTARLGLKFFDLDLNATRTLQKAINFYMLEEQRLRNRMT
jgi:hypothetical protein